jgi:very-short-patch-repair endonuclease
VFDEAAIRLAERHHGVVSIRALRDCGASRSDIQSLRDSRHWECVGTSVLRRVGSASTELQRVTIAVLDDGPGSVLSHSSAAHLWGVRGCSLAPIHVVTTVSSRYRSTSVRRHRVRRLPAEWRTELDGIPIARPELTALQLFASFRYEKAERLVDALWSMRLLSIASIGRFVVDMGRMGRNGTAGVRRYLDDRPQGDRPPESGLESRTIQILRSAGLALERQVDVGSDDRWTGRVDMRMVGTKVVVEVQSRRHHTALSDVVADRARRVAIEAAGFTVVEVWDDEVWTRPNVVIDRVRRAVADDRARR